MAQSALFAAFLAGLFGGAHCVAMCGGYLAASAERSSGPTPLRPLAQLRRQWLWCHAGRLAVYVALGLAFGAAGGAAASASWPAAQRGVYALANVMLLLVAITVLRGRVSMPLLERAGLALYARVRPFAQPRPDGAGAWPRFALGLLWGLTPCALIYAVLPVAMLSGSALDGALVMAAFGLGTLPNLAAAGWVLVRARRFVAPRLARIAAAALIAAFALFGLWRAAFVADALAHGAFCLVP